MSARLLATAFAMLVFTSTMALPKLACADTVINVCGKFSFWVPDDWKETKDAGNAERTSFESPDDGSLFVLVGPLMDKDADLIDEDVVDFVDDELDDMKVTSDKRDVLEKFKVRLVEGTGTDEGDPVAFKLLALDPDSDIPVLAILVYGDARAMNRPASQAVIERILHSLRPHP
jgi:hypothetical protein